MLALYRIRGPLFGVAAVTLLLIAASGWMPLPPSVRAAIPVTGAVAVALGVLVMAVTVFGPRLLPQHEPRVVASPVRGRWLAMNSPATKVPSHGIRAYGQAYAVDLVAEPADRERPAFGAGPAWRRSVDYPAFGEPVHAMIDGVVVTATDWRRDHHARSSYPALLYLGLLEAPIRELGGPGFIVGNHIVIRGDDGIFALVAHLQRGSAQVAVGERVTAGQVIARCGNSGNSSEPHVHAQLMDRARPLTGQGVPMTFSGIRITDAETGADASEPTGDATADATADATGDPRDGIPADGQHLHA